MSTKKPLNAKAVREYLRRGALLQRSYYSTGPVWSLSNGREVRPEVARRCSAPRAERADLR